MGHSPEPYRSTPIFIIAFIFYDTLNTCMSIPSQIFQWNFFVAPCVSFLISRPVVLRVARVCGDILLMVGVSRSGLAAVLQTFVGGALWEAPHRPRPPAPAHDGLPECHRSWRTALVCREKPRWPLQTHRTSASHFRPLHGGHEDSYRRLHAGGGPCSQRQKSEWPAARVHAQMMMTNSNKLVHEDGGFFSAGQDEGIHWKKKSAWKLTVN